MKKPKYSVYVWRPCFNREDCTLEPLPVLIMSELNSIKSANKFIEFYKVDRYKLRGCRFDICEDGIVPTLEHLEQKELI